MPPQPPATSRRDPGGGPRQAKSTAGKGAGGSMVVVLKSWGWRFLQGPFGLRIGAQHTTFGAGTGGRLRQIPHLVCLGNVLFVVE